MAITAFALIAIDPATSAPVEDEQESGPPSPAGLVSFCDVPGTSGSQPAACAQEVFTDSLATGTSVDNATSGDLTPIDSTSDLGYGAEDLPNASGGQPDPTPGWGTSETSTASADNDDLNGAQAKSRFEGTFDPLIDAIDRPLVPNDVEVVTYTSDTTAVVDPPGRSPDALLDSTVPIRVPGTVDTPVDLGLEQQGGELEPDAPAVDVDLPSDSAAPAELTDAEVEVAYDAPGPSNQEPATDPVAIDDVGLFYPNAGPDTDLFVAPRPSGLEVFAQIRSAQAPDDIEFDVDLPEGARMVESGDIPGFIEIQEGSETIASISPPLAYDADGGAIEASQSVVDGELVLSVPHDGSDAFPILADPQITDTYDFPSNPNFNGWSAWENDADYDQIAWSSYFTPGMYGYALSGRTYGSGTLGGFFYYVPHFDTYTMNASSTTSYISSAYFGSLDFTSTNGSASAPSMALGMWDMQNNRWVKLSTWHQQTTFPWGMHMDWDTLEPGTSVTDAKRLDFQIYNALNQPEVTPSVSKMGRVSNANVYLSDPEQAEPYFVDGFEGWYDGSGAITAKVGATDPGLGVKTVGLFAGWNEAEDVAFPSAFTTDACPGTYRSQCPETWTDYSASTFQVPTSNMREGLQAAWPTAFDPLGQGKFTGQWFGIDRSPPTVNDDSFVEELSGGAYRIHVRAQDGNAGQRRTAEVDDRVEAQSGVESIDVLVNGVSPGPQYHAEQQCAGDGLDNGGNPNLEIPWASCEMRRTFDLSAAQLSGGTVEVRVEDHSGNVQVYDPFEDSQDDVNVQSTCTDPVLDEGDVDPIYESMDPSAIEEIGIDLFGARFAGKYYEATCPSHYVALIQDGSSSEIAQYEAALNSDPRTTGDPIEVHATPFTESRLADGASEVRQALSSYSDAAVSVDIKTQELTVFTSETATQTQKDVADETLSDEGLASVDVSWRQAEFESYLNSRNGFPPYYAGTSSESNFDFPPAGPFEGCTNGYMLELQGNNVVGSTAGHCSDQHPEAFFYSGSFVQIGQAKAGWNAYSSGTTADARMFRLPDRHATKRIYTKPDRFRYISDRYRNSNLDRGLGLCLQGANVGGICGRIREFVPEGEDEQGTVLKELVCLRDDDPNRSPGPGDSGAPVYHITDDRTVRAAGMVQGGLEGTGLTCFSRIGNILDRLNASLPTTNRTP